MENMIRSAPGNELERVRSRFELWRKTRKGHAPIPEALWASAVELVREHGLCRTARVLRLNYYALKKRLAAVEDVPSRPERKPAFIELLPPGSSSSSACTIEMENARGEKMKIHLPGLVHSDLALLTDRFWRARS